MMNAWKYLFLSLTLAAAATAEEKQELATVSVGTSAYATESNNPPCSSSVNFTQMLQDPKILAAVAAVDAEAAVIVAGSAQLADWTTKNHGGEISKFITGLNGGDRSTCESVCVFLPKGSQIQEIRISNRSGQENWRYFRTTQRGLSHDPKNGNPNDPNAPEVLTHGGVLNTFPLDWSGWEGLTVGNKAASVCGTAKNWSHDSKTNQILRVIYTQ